MFVGGSAAGGGMVFVVVLRNMLEVPQFLRSKNCGMVRIARG